MVGCIDCPLCCMKLLFNSELVWLRICKWIWPTKHICNYLMNASHDCIGLWIGNCCDDCCNSIRRSIYWNSTPTNSDPFHGRIEEGEGICTMFTLSFEYLTFLACFGKVGDIFAHVFPMKMLSHVFNKTWASWMKQLLMKPLNQSRLQFQWNKNFVIKIYDELTLKKSLFVRVFVECDCLLLELELW